jgi:hypothetical protein
MAVGFNLPDPYEAQKAEIARRRKYAETLQQQAFQPTEPFSYQGIQAPIPATATLAKVLQGLAGGYMQAESSREERELREGDIKKGQEFAAALQGAKTPEERQALATTALGGTLGQRAQAMAGPIFTMAETAAEREANRAFRETESAKAREAQASNQEANRQNQLLMASMMAQLRAQGMSDTAAFREAQLRLQEDTARTRQEAERNKLPVPVITAYGTAAQNERQAGSVVQSVEQHIEDIKTGKLPLGVVPNTEAQLRNWLGKSTPESVLYADFLRTIDQSVNAVLSAAKGTQTEGDAIRARNQILRNPNDAAVVQGALKDLAKSVKESQDIYRNTLNQLGSRYSGLEHQRMEPVLPPRAPAAPGAPPAPAAPGAPPAPAAPGAPPAPGAPAAPGGQQRPAAAPAAPAVGTVVNGYRFKGGDPANEANWERL